MGTITNAMRGKSVLDSFGYKCSITRTIGQASREGCGYSLIFAENDLRNAEKAETILKQNGLKIRGVLFRTITR